MSDNSARDLCKFLCLVGGVPDGLFRLVPKLVELVLDGLHGIVHLPGKRFELVAGGFHDIVHLFGGIGKDFLHLLWKVVFAHNRFQLITDYKYKKLF